MTSIEGEDDSRLHAQEWTQKLLAGFRSDESSDEAKTSRRKMERGVARGAIETWLQLGHASLELRWPTQGRPAVGFHVDGLFGSLGVQLLLVAAGSSGFAICAGCGLIFAPPRGRGRPALYCADCKAEHKPQKLADDRRLRKKAEGAG